MLKRWASFILILAMIFSFTAVFGDEQQGPKVYTITVTEEGGKYQFDNVELIFKKDSIEDGMQPITFTVALYAENGIPYIDIEPSVESFAKDVTIKVQKGELELYDTVTGKTIKVELKNFTFKAEHFSRYIILT